MHKHFLVKTANGRAPAVPAIMGEGPLVSGNRQCRNLNLFRVFAIRFNTHDSCLRLTEYSAFALVCRLFTFDGDNDGGGTGRTTCAASAAGNRRRGLPKRVRREHISAERVCPSSWTQARLFAERVQVHGLRHFVFQRVHQRVHGLVGHSLGCSAKTTLLSSGIFVSPQGPIASKRVNNQWFRVTIRLSTV